MALNDAGGADADALLLDVRDVGKRFGDGAGERWVLSDLSFVVQRGEKVALWGPSGSGKSTLLGLIAGLDVPTRGSIQFFPPTGETPIALADETEQARSAYRRRYIGYIFQFFNLIPTLTVAENVELPLEVNGLENPKAALDRLNALSMADHLDDFPATLSGGEQQRVAIARALAHGPALVLADEPTGNLDLENATLVTDLLWREVDTARTGLIVATHSEAIASRADRVIELR